MNPTPPYSPGDLDPGDQMSEQRKKLKKMRQSMETNTDGPEGLQTVNGGIKSSYLTPVVKMGPSPGDLDPSAQRSEQRKKLKKMRQSIKRKKNKIQQMQMVVDYHENEDKDGDSSPHLAMSRPEQKENEMKGNTVRNQEGKEALVAANLSLPKKKKKMRKTQEGESHIGGHIDSPLADDSCILTQKKALVDKN